MMKYVQYMTAVLLLASGGRAENSTITNDTCELEPWDNGPWGQLLEDWATAPLQNDRQGRIMALPPAKGYYVTDRIDLVPPPPPHLQPPMGHHQPGPSPHAPHGHHPHPGPQAGSPPRGYEEWQSSPPSPPNTGKIVNRPPKPYKDKFKPSYPGPSPNQPIPVHQQQAGSAVDRVDEQRPPAQTQQQHQQKQVSETDLYLLGAIEKLVFRVDLMEKRLRKVEENMHYLVAGADAKPEPCASNYTRVGSGCYHLSSDSVNWKNANYACRKLKGNLLELDSDEERRHLTSKVLTDARAKGADFWTGGLNPGLLWIWSHSARPVGTNGTTASNGSANQTIAGEGRCLAWVHDPALNNYVYRGQDCSLRHRYICEKDEDKTKLSNEVERVARKIKDTKRKAKILWNDDD